MCAYIQLATNRKAQSATSKTPKVPTRTQYASNVHATCVRTHTFKGIKACDVLGAQERSAQLQQEKTTRVIIIVVMIREFVCVCLCVLVYVLVHVICACVRMEWFRGCTTVCTLSVCNAMRCRMRKVNFST